MEPTEFDKKIIEAERKRSIKRKWTKVILSLFIIAFITFVIIFNNSKNEISTNHPITEDTFKSAKNYWSIDSFVDDFGDATNEKFIAQKTTGTFSNSATTNSFLGVKIIVTKASAGVFLHEYDWSRSAVYFIGGGKMSLKDSKGGTLKLYVAGKWNNSGGIPLSKKDLKSLVKFLKAREGEIKVNMQDDYSSDYNFTINTTGFDSLYSTL